MQEKLEYISSYRDSERLYTNIEQTKTLLSFGFPKPIGICLSPQGDIMCESNYSIGELLMWITPYRIERHPEYGYKIIADYEPSILIYNESLIDGLYEVIVELYKAGQYDEPEKIENPKIFDLCDDIM